MGDEVDLSFLRKNKGPFERKKLCVSPVSSRIAIKRKRRHSSSLPLEGEGLTECVPLPLSRRKEDGLTIAHCSVFIRPLDRRRPQKSLPVVRGGGTACPPAVTEGIATDEETSFHRLLLINLIPHRRAMVPLPLPGEGLTMFHPFRSISIREEKVEAPSLFSFPSLS